jgi:hypothetical protein
MYGTHGTDIVGYTFNGDEYCPGCILNMFGNVLDTSAEALMDREAAALGIDRQDERSYDSGDFPKVIFGSDVESDEERCGGCGESLIP